jgi:two-component system, cell cycle sensor histidine kinase and response regulator CckA
MKEQMKNISILLMDDEEMLRETTGELLDILGYDVAFASEGREAINLYMKMAASHRPFDAVMLDLNIRGGIGGIETLKKIIEFDPGVKALLLTGYTYDLTITEYMDMGFKDVMLKPFSLEELETALDSLTI